MMKISIKKLGDNFGNSIPDNSKWDKTSEGIATKYISGTEWDSLNCVSYVKFVLFQNIPKNNIWFPLAQEKNMTS